MSSLDSLQIYTQGIAYTESLSPSASPSPNTVADISQRRWHMEVKDVYPESRSLGSDMQQIVANIAPMIFQRGGFIYTDLTWAVASKSPKIRQFVLTTSDYCKLYVSAVVFHVRVPASDIPLPSGDEEFVHIPLSFGMISRVPYLTFPKLFLSHLCHACSEPIGLEKVLTESIAQLVHGVPIPHGSSALSMWNLPPLDDTHNELVLYMGDVGITGTSGEENHPIQSTFARSFTEVDLVALFDVLSLEVIVSVINALLLEQKVLLISSKWPASFIAHLCEAFRTLLYPFDWQHVYIPLIPTCDTAHDNLPFWLGSATGPEHVHPLRFLEVPAPLFGGLKLRSRSLVPLSEYFGEKFPDVNLVDLDHDIFFPARTRIDQVETPLPHFPRKLLQLITIRLAPILDNFRNKSRMHRYMNWDRVVPREIFSNITISPIEPRNETQRRHSSSSSSGGVIDSSGRRRSLIRTSFTSAQSSGTLVVTSSGTWLGGFSSLFRTHTRTSRGTIISTSSSRGSSVEAPATEVAGEFASTDDSDFELTATTLIQSAFIEAFVRIFFAYKDFLIFEQPAEDMHQSHVEGSDRFFQIRQFLKCVDRHGIFGTDSMNFIKTFITTQSWDLFIRTTALTSTAHLFDTACAYYCTANKLEYTKFKQTNMSIIIQENQVYAELPAAVEKELEVLRPCPSGIKPKEFFFDELKSLILRLRKCVETVFVAGRMSCVSDIETSSTKPDSPVSVIGHVLGSILPNFFANDPNSEAVKYSNLDNPKPGLMEFIQLIVEVFSDLDNEGKKDHLLHAILNGKKIQLASTPLVLLPEDQVGGMDSATPSTPPPRSNTLGVSTLWSYKRSPLFRAFSVNADDQEWGKKILGGIPKSAANVPVPAVPSYLMRNWSKVGNGHIRFVVSASELAGIDFACQNCGTCKNFDWIIETGKFFTQQTGLVHAACPQCKHLVYVNLIPTSHRSAVKLSCLGSILDSILDLPITLGTFLELQFLMGLNVEVYTTASEESRRELRGVVSLIDVLLDFATQTEILNEEKKTESEKIIVNEDKVEEVKCEGIMTPRSRARMRIREYRKKQRVKSSPVPVIRINVDRSVSPPLGKPGGPAVPFRRRLSGGGNNQRSSPESPPAPPSERRPAEAAPRRVHRRSSEFFKP